MRKRFMLTKVGKEVLIYFAVLAVGAVMFIWIGGFGYRKYQYDRIRKARAGRNAIQDMDICA